MLGLCYAFWGLGYLIKIPFNVNSSIFAQVSTII